MSLKGEGQEVMTRMRVQKKLRKTDPEIWILIKVRKKRKKKSLCILMLNLRSLDKYIETFQDSRNQKLKRKL